MKIPSEAVWRSEAWDLDARSAYEHFFGKSIEDAVALLIENSLYYQEEIVAMPFRCFQYYVLAYTNYLQSESSRRDADGASCFLSLVELRKDDIMRSPRHVIHEITSTLEKLQESQLWYDAPENIYGDFRERAKSCLKHIQAD